MFEIGLSVVFGLVATIFSRDDLEWTPKRADGSPLIDDGWSSIGHQVVGSLLACALCTPLCTPSPPRALRPCPVAGRCPGAEAKGCAPPRRWSSFVLRDANLVTGQNPASSGAAAQQILALLT